MKLNLTTLLRVLLIFCFAAAFLSSCKKGGAGEDAQPEAPQISSIQPKNPQPGETVTITGSGFGATATDVKVSIGTTEVTVASVSNTEIKFVIPAALASGPLAVQIKGIAAVNKDPQGVAITVTPKAVVAPTFTNMQPATGKTGDVITLTGTGFNAQASENKVFFATTTGGTVVLATIKSASTTQLTVEVPANVVTGTVLITVSGTNAVPATGFNSIFTATTTTGTGSSSVAYINATQGALSYSLFATATKEIGAMTLDRVKSIIYYSDYTLLNTAEGQNTVYKVAIEGSGTPAVLTNDARIGKIVKVTTDAAGNVFVLKYEVSPSTYSVYKITPDGSTVTEVIKNFNMASGYTSNYFFFINTANEICIRPGFKISSSGTIMNTETAMYGIMQKDGGAVIDGNNAFLIQNTDNNAKASNSKFIKWNMAAGTIADAGFTLNTLFGTDDPSLFSTNANISNIKYAVDGNNNVYTLMDHTYISGQLSKTWMLRKYNPTTNTSTLIGTFLVKFPALDLTEFNGNVEFVGDARGNLYFKANTKDIIVIKQ